MVKPARGMVWSSMHPSIITLRPAAVAVITEVIFSEEISLALYKARYGPPPRRAVHDSPHVRLH